MFELMSDVMNQTNYDLGGDISEGSAGIFVGLVASFFVYMIYRTWKDS